MFVSVNRQNFLGALLVWLLAPFLVATLIPREARAVETEITATCDEGPPPVILELPYNANTAGCVISPVTDNDQFTFNATAGTDLRINVAATTVNLDPTIEVRDPNGTLVINGPADGGQCISPSTSGCTFSVNLIPALSGMYSILLFDDFNNNTGSYQLSLWCVDGACPGKPVPQALSHVLAIADSLTPQLDGDFFTFNATAGTDLRINVAATTVNLDPTIEVRDPNGTLVINGPADGGQCISPSTSGCTFSVNLIPALSGMYSVLLFDDFNNNTGSYELSLWCLLGDCDSDGDGFVDNDRRNIDYGQTIADEAVSPQTDGDFFVFMRTAGDQVRISVTGTTVNLDPTIEVRDPNGTLVINGPADGGQCISPSTSGCAFSVDLPPGITGTYTAALYDDFTNNTGTYNIALTCLFGTCSNLTLPVVPCADNCSVHANPTQIDSDDDGYGNRCDGDLNNNLFTNAQDYVLFRQELGQPSTPPTYNIADLNYNGFVNAQDYVLFRQLLGSPPGPSGLYCAGTGISCPPVPACP